MNIVCVTVCIIIVSVVSDVHKVAYDGRYDYYLISVPLQPIQEGYVYGDFSPTN